MNARAETARVVGRWVDVTRAVYRRLKVVCGLVWPLRSSRTECLFRNLLVFRTENTVNKNVHSGVWQ
jgi:hypothetical protein